MNEDEKNMKVAISEAILAKNEGEIPVGAIIIQDGKIIATGHNQPILANDPTAHAEIQAIRAAGEKIKNYRLVNSTLYVTLEPCMMCLGAIMHARIERVIFGTYDSKNGACQSYMESMNSKKFNHKINITGGILENECHQLLQSFFKLRRGKKLHNL
tara:strand:+ start:1018 stop:1488 length:471 start_codon:yes stop_codon:yes gene_type:complete